MVGPGLQQRIQGGARIHQQPHGAQRTRTIEQGRDQAVEGKGKRRVAAQLDDDRPGLCQRQLQGLLLGLWQLSGGGALGVQQQPALRIDQVGRGVAHLLHEDGQALAQRRLLGR